MDINNELSLSNLLIVIVAAICIGMTYQARMRVKKDGKINNNAQYVVSIGVLGTFVGILIGLYDFQTGDSEIIAKSINNFLDGMKLAFVTSVLGMFCSLLIKLFQGKLEGKQSEATEKNLENLNTLEKLKEAVIKTGEDSNMAMGKMLAAMNSMAADSAATQNKLNQVSEGLTTLLDVMRHSSQAGIAESIKSLTGVISGMESATKENNVMTSHMAEVMGQQNEQIALLKNTMVTNGQQQLENLNAMRENTKEMRTLADKSYVVSTELYNKTMEFHANMAQSSARQEAILAENNQGLQDMRKSFDQFLEQVADNFSKSFIEALTQSIERLNIELQEQLGGNFQKLNQAVTDLLNWQVQYKGIIESSYNQLNAFLESVKAFDRQVAETMPALLGQMDNSIEKLGSSVSATDAALEAFKQQLQVKLAEYAEDLTTSLLAHNAAIGSHLDNVMGELKNNMSSYTGVVMDNVRNSFEQMNRDVAANMQENNKAVSDMLNSSMEDMQKVFGRFNEVLLAGVSSLNNQLRDTMADYKNAMLENLHESFAGMNKDIRNDLGNSFNVLLTVMEENINKFYNTQEKVLAASQEKFIDAAGEMLEKGTKEINSRLAQSLRNFDDTVNISFEETMEAVQKDFEKMSNNIAIVSEQQVKELGAALVAITNKMTGNYTTMMEELAKLHRILMANGER